MPPRPYGSRACESIPKRLLWGDEILRGILAVIALGLSVAGCATTTENKLTETERRSLKIVSTQVNFATDATMVWPDEGRKLTQAGMSPEEAKVTTKATATEKLQEAMQRVAGGAFQSGDRPAKLDVRIHTFMINTKLALLLAPGNDAIIADVDVVDAKTGTVLSSVPRFEGRLSDSGGILGLVASGVVPDSVDRLTNRFADSYCLWLKNGSQIGMGQQFQSMSLCKGI